MAAGLSYRAIVELINSDNESGLKSFLETRHANVDDKHEVQTEFQKVLRIRPLKTKIPQNYV